MSGPSYTFREGLEPTAYQVWHGDDSGVIHEQCAGTIWDREFPLYDDDIETMRNLESIVCDVCDGEIARAKLR